MIYIPSDHITRQTIIHKVIIVASTTTNNNNLFLDKLLTVSYMFRYTSVMAALVPDQAVIVLLVVPGKMHSLVIEWDAMESLD